MTKIADIDTSINIFRRREEILYRRQTENDSVNIAYFSSKPLSSVKSLFIADRSTSLVANRVQQSSNYILYKNIITNTISTDKFLVTDTFTEDMGTIGQLPLFFKHIISSDKLPRISSSDLTLTTEAKLISVDTLDTSLNAINLPDLKIDFNKGIVYNNLLSSFDTISSDYKIFFIRYTLKINNNIFTYIDLINNEDIYRIATIDDLDASLSIIQDGRKVYLVEEVDNNFKVTLPSISTYAFKTTANSKLQIIPPPPLDINNPWRVSISNTKFFARVSGHIYKYSIAEFLNQAWNPFAPYKFSKLEDSEILTNTIIKTNHNRIIEDNDLNLFVDILINSSEDIGVAAFTTDINKVGTIANNETLFQKWTNINRLGIKSIDHKGGFIEVEGLKLLSTYKIKSSYYFEEENYEFSIFDFNPINNQSVLNERVSLFIDPDSDGSLKTQTLYYLITNKSGKITQSNWPSFDNNAQLTTDGNLLYFEMVPDYITNSGVKQFIPTYSTEGDGTLLVLGDLYITEETSPDQALTVDTRIPGGGLTESGLDDLRVRNIESNSYFDMGFVDGIPYPANSSFLVEVPVEIMDGAGGLLKANEIRDIVNRHVAAGVYPIVKAYGIDPTISGMVPSETSISIVWRSYND